MPVQRKPGNLSYAPRIWYKSMGGAIVIYYFSGLYNKSHIQSVCNVIERKLKPG